MKSILLPLGLLLGLVQPAVAQTCEITGRAGLGLLRFGGPDARAASFVNYTPNDASFSYTNSPYGSRLGTGVVLGLRVQRVGARRGLLALDLGYEWLRSRTSITEVYYSPGLASSFRGSYNADGSTCLSSRNLTAFWGWATGSGSGWLQWMCWPARSWPTDLAFGSAEAAPTTAT